MKVYIVVYETFAVTRLLDVYSTMKEAQKFCKGKENLIIVEKQVNNIKGIIKVEDEFPKLDKSIKQNRKI